MTEMERRAIDELQSLTAVEIIADDKDQIPYRRALNAVTGSVTATILLQQILFRWKNNRRKPFYKFTAPCTHKAYRETDSWIEELGFTPAEFDGARNRIATKITRATLAKELADVPSESPRERIKARSLVVYYTDADRKTWYDVNPQLLQQRLIEIYAISENADYVNGKSAVTGNEEIADYPIQESTEITTREGGEKTSPLPAEEQPAEEPYQQEQIVHILKEKNTCGHLMSSVVTGEEGTAYCQECADVAALAAMPSAQDAPVNPQQTMIGALAQVCGIDLTLCNGKYAKAAKRLVKSGYTAEQITTFYGEEGDWYRKDWRGCMGDPPNIGSINETIQRAVLGTWKQNDKTQRGAIEVSL